MGAVALVGPVVRRGGAGGRNGHGRRHISSAVHGLASERIGLDVTADEAAMTGGRAGLPGAARGVVAAWAATGLVTLALAMHRLWVAGWPTLTDVVVAAVFGALLAASWVWPIALSIDDQSDTFDLDEAFFVLLILLVPAAMTVGVFAVVAILVQALKNRSLFKSVFNAGRVVTSAGVAALVFVLLHGPAHTVGYAQVGGGAGCVRVLPGAQHRRHRLHPGHARDAVAGGRVRRSLGQAARRRRRRRLSRSRRPCLCPLTRSSCRSPSCPCSCSALWGRADSPSGTTG